MTTTQRCLTATAITAVAYATMAALGHLVDGEPLSPFDSLAAALAARIVIFLAWPAIDERWTRRDRADDPKRFAYMAGGLAVGIGLSALPRLFGVSELVLFGILVATFVALLASALIRRARNSPPAH
jgi:hypothetical protein